MKKLFFLLMLVAVALVSCNKYSYESVEGDPMQTRIYTLKNGLKVYLSVNKESPRVTAHIAVKTGSKNDPAETTGLAHYLEHLMFKGSTHFGTTDYEAEKVYLDQIRDLYEKYRTLTDPEERKAMYHQIDSVSQLAAQYNIPNEYDKMMASIGAEGSNAYTWFDITCYTEDVPSNEIENWAKIQSDRFMNMVIRGFHTELEAVYEEKNISLGSDDEKAFDALLAKVFPTHPYGTQTTLGTQEHLKNPSIINIENYFKKYYVPNNVAICMSGDFDPDATIAIIDKYFGSWKKSSDFKAPEFAPMAELTTPQDTTVYGQEKENLTMAWRFQGAASLQNDTLQLLSEVLSNGRAGLIDLDLNQKMLVQDARASLLDLADYSAFAMDVVPNPGQTLEDAQALLLAEVDKLKKGEFDDDLLISVVNNMKRRYYESLDRNESRVSLFVNAFINGTPWASQVGQIDRISHITKADLISFANTHLTNGYAVCYKRQGEDLNVKKIDKPAITAIPANREFQSQFLVDILNAKVDPIQPQFLDFKKDLTFAQAGPLPVIYKQNETDDLFTLQFKYDFGSSADKYLMLASSYLNLLGTDKLSAEQVKKQFYKLACDFHLRIQDDNLYISLSGLNENLPAALQLLENLLQHAQADTDAYQHLVEQELKERQDMKLNQRACFNYLYQYALQGPNNSLTQRMLPEAELKTIDPQTLLDHLKVLSSTKHTVLYYGPSTESELAELLGKEHQLASNLQDAPANVAPTYLETPENEVVIAPYDAKNIYMRMIHNEGLQWTPERAPILALFNEYFGGGMNTIVFQELREARGLAYNAFARYMTPNNVGEPEYAFMHIISQNDKMMDCINTFKEILDTIPQSEASFEVSKQSLLKSLASARTTKMRIIDAYIRAQRLGIDYDINQRIYEALPALTLADIVSFEKEVLANKPFRYVVLGNEKELDMASLQKIGPIKRVSIDEILCPAK